MKIDQDDFVVGGRMKATHSNNIVAEHQAYVFRTF